MQILQKLGLVLIGAGLIVAAGYFLYWFLGTDLIALGFRAAVGAVVVGFVILLIAAGWERCRSIKGKENSFKEVKY